jgi:hypothetical protein
MAAASRLQRVGCAAHRARRAYLCVSASGGSISSIRENGIGVAAHRLVLATPTMSRRVGDQWWRWRKRRQRSEKP